MKTQKSLSIEQLSIIKQMHKGNQSIYTIAKVIGVDKKVVAKYLDEALALEQSVQKNNSMDFKLFMVALKEKIENAKLQTKIELVPYMVESKSQDTKENHYQLDIYIRGIVNTTNTNVPDKKVRFFIIEDLLKDIDTTSNKILSKVVVQNDLV